MNKTQRELAAKTAALAAIARKIDQLTKISADQETRKMLMDILTAGLDAEFATKAGL